MPGPRAAEGLSPPRALVTPQRARAPGAEPQAGPAPLPGPPWPLCAGGGCLQDRGSGRGGGHPEAGQRELTRGLGPPLLPQGHTAFLPSGCALGRGSRWVKAISSGEAEPASRAP